MWLLRTTCTELRYFNEPPSNYAILSHVWDGEEQSFQDLRAILTSPDSLSKISPKVRDSCGHAASEGYEWLWIDTCCIDKSSSAELSEAINSMYQWYANATVCYAYLRDVPGDQNPYDIDSAFCKSAWFTRGWTLQELLAPRHVQFLSKEWVKIGDKTMFASLLEAVTGIDTAVLTFRVPLSSIPVAERMRWASQRKTTRVEDEAYSLMGIFGVHLPTIYGEGKRAFRRLQEEIMKYSTDHSLFLWGPPMQLYTMTEWIGTPSEEVPMLHQDLLADSVARFGEGWDDDLPFRRFNVSTVSRFLGTIASLARLFPAQPTTSETAVQVGRTNDIDIHNGLTTSHCRSSLPPKPASGSPGGVRGIHPQNPFPMTLHQALSP